MRGGGGGDTPCIIGFSGFKFNNFRFNKLVIFLWNSMGDFIVAVNLNSGVAFGAHFFLQLS